MDISTAKRLEKSPKIPSVWLGSSKQSVDRVIDLIGARNSLEEFRKTLTEAQVETPGHIYDILQGFRSRFRFAPLLACPQQVPLRKVFSKQDEHILVALISVADSFLALPQVKKLHRLYTKKEAKMSKRIEKIKKQPKWRAFIEPDRAPVEAVKKETVKKETVVEAPKKEIIVILSTSDVDKPSPTSALGELYSTEESYLHQCIFFRDTIVQRLISDLPKVRGSKDLKQKLEQFVVVLNDAIFFSNLFLGTDYNNSEKSMQTLKEVLSKNKLSLISIYAKLSLLFNDINLLLTKFSLLSEEVLKAMKKIDLDYPDKAVCLVLSNYLSQPTQRIAKYKLMFKKTDLEAQFKEISDQVDAICKKS
jgi:hypothetical protein